MSLTYTTFLNSIANLMTVPTTDPNFLIDLPNMIDYAEQRIYRELDFLVTRKTDSNTLTIQNRNFSLPTTVGTFLVVEDVNVFTPVGTTTATGTRHQLVPSTKQFINYCYPSAIANNGIPEFFAMLDNATIVLGPAPDQAYLCEVTGTQRPFPLSSSNTSTWLSTNLPDLFLAAAMVRATGYQKNWGSQSDDPKMAMSWENTYQALKASAAVEEFRKMARSQGWTVENPSPISTPPRM